MVFGSKDSHNTISIIILTVVALHGNLSMGEISSELGLSYKELYRFVDNLEKYFQFLVATGEGFSVSNTLLEFKIPYKNFAR